MRGALHIGERNNVRGALSIGERIKPLTLTLALSPQGRGLRWAMLSP